jgi:hypothetical protein
MNLTTHLQAQEANYNPDLHLLGETWNGPGYHSRVPNGIVKCRQTLEVLGLDESASSLRRGMVANVRREGGEYMIGLADLTFSHLDKTSAEWLAMFHWWVASSSQWTTRVRSVTISL